ncbi:MAG: hypothetical protein DRP45_03695 [Candidatus Zixiibacteriota bacterium]|nr:MAG: hypothetical protein DRP45_03695 [candidate division Zixibacteria bacterium]
MWWRNGNLFTRLLGVMSLALVLLTPAIAQQNAADNSDPSVPIKNLRFQAAEIRSVLTFLADYGDVNVVVAPNVSGSVTIHLQDVHWRIAMDIIGRTYDLAIVDEEGGYIRVLQAEKHRKEVTEQHKHEATQRELVDLETVIMKVSNSVAEDMVETVQSLMSARGKASADARSNSLILQEVPEHLPVVLEYIAQLDSPARQIKISAQLLEISSKGLQELGVNWKIAGTYSEDNGRQYSQTGEVLTDLVTGEAGRYSVGVLGQDWTLDGFIQAVVSDGKGKIVAHPEIITIENAPARIQMGQKIPIKQFDESGNVVIKFEEVGTILEVTPHITAEDQVLMYLRPERSFVEFDAAGVIINTNNAETNIIVNNGQTAVIGGLTTQDEVELDVGVPILKDIPIFGRLFKYTSTKIESRDLVIFVTPTIIDTDLAMND